MATYITPNGHQSLIPTDTYHTHTATLPVPSAPISSWSLTSSTVSCDFNFITAVPTLCALHYNPKQRKDTATSFPAQSVMITDDETTLLSPHMYMQGNPFGFSSGTEVLHCPSTRNLATGGGRAGTRVRCSLG